MKISLNWIKDYVTYGLSTEKLSHKLTMAGLEVEAVVKSGGDTVMEFEVTPNRADCLSMIGIAREIATVTEKKLHTPTITKPSRAYKKFDIDIEDTKDCVQYIATVIEHVTVKPSDKKIQQCLSAVGARPVNNIVDATNFVLMEQGQPLHAFDLDKITGGKVFVRRAIKGETLVAINGETYKLDPTILIIADAEKPIAIAGIMGGKETEVGSDTKNILLESAYFNPVLIRRAGRKLGLSSDSSYRFERGVDFEGVERGSRRATQLVLDSAKGQVTHESRAGLRKNPQKQKKIRITYDFINAYLGTQVTKSRINAILSSLEFKVVKKDKNIDVIPPSFRSDIHRAEDIVEEIGRIIGYDQLPTSLPAVPAADIGVHSGRVFRDQLREVLIGQGLNEIITFTLMSEEDIKKSGMGDEPSLRLVNPLSLDQAVMKPGMLPSMLSVARGNINKGQKDIALFELGKIYTAQAHEREVLAMIASGKRNADWREAAKEIDFYDLKGLLQQTFRRLHLPPVSLQKKPRRFLDEYESAAVMYGKKEIGYIGKMNTDIIRQWDIKDGHVYCLEIELPRPQDQKKRKFKTISDFPVITQDVSLAADQNVSFSQVEEIVREKGGALLKDVHFNELYMGEKIPQGQRGLVFSCVYQSKERTLREKEVLDVHESVVQALIQSLGVIRR